jgi:hypothetical protein
VRRPASPTSSTVTWQLTMLASVVSVAESFSIAHHTQTPPVLMLDLPHPQHVAKSTWSTSELDYRRPTSATFVICNGAALR